MHMVSPSCRARSAMLFVPEQQPAFFGSTRIHRLPPDAEVFASIRVASIRGAAKYGGAAVASAARVTRAGAKLLEPIFQRKRLLRLRLGIPADRMLLASRLGGRSAVPCQGFGIGWALMCGRCGRRWAFGGWTFGRGHLSGQSLQGRSLRGWCFWERYMDERYLDQRYLDERYLDERYLDERSRDAWQKGRRHFRGRGWPWCRADRTRCCAVHIRR